MTSATNPKDTLSPNSSIKKYILERYVFPKEHEQLKELRDDTRNKYDRMSCMAVPPDEAQLWAMILKLMGAKKTIEVGVFTGYSLLATALALPEDGKAIGIDPDREAYEVGIPSLQKAGVEEKIQFIQAPAMDVLDEFLNDVEKEGSFDAAFVDADKDNYIEYHKRLLKLVRVGGLIAYDNTLWYGSVAVPETAEMPQFVRAKRSAVLEFNNFIASDSRIEVTQLDIADGLTLCRRIE